MKNFISNSVLLLVLTSNFLYSQKYDDLKNNPAYAINKFLVKWYTKFGYKIKIVPKTSIINRIDFIFENI